MQALRDALSRTGNNAKKKSGRSVNAAILLLMVKGISLAGNICLKEGSGCFSLAR
jgi:hypothetical protein